MSILRSYVFTPDQSATYDWFVSYRIAELTTLGDKLKEQNAKKEKTISALKMDIQKLVYVPTNPPFLSLSQANTHSLTDIYTLTKMHGLIHTHWLALPHTPAFSYFLCPFPMSISEKLLVFEH